LEEKFEDTKGCRKSKNWIQWPKEKEQ